MHIERTPDCNHSSQVVGHITGPYCKLRERLGRPIRFYPTGRLAQSPGQFLGARWGVTIVDERGAEYHVTIRNSVADANGLLNLVPPEQVRTWLVRSDDPAVLAMLGHLLDQPVVAYEYAGDDGEQDSHGQANGQPRRFRFIPPIYGRQSNERMR